MRDGTLYVIDGVTYRWMGPGLGAQLHSLEWRRSPAGTQRELRGVRFTLFQTYRTGLRVCHAWGVTASASVDDTQARIRDFLGRSS